MKNDFKTSIEMLDMPVEVVKVLRKHNIDTVEELIIARDLNMLPIKSLKEEETERLLIACKEAERLFELQEESFFLDDIDERNNNTSPVSDVLRKHFRSDRNYSILVDYYNSRGMATLRFLGKKYNLSGERIRQIIERGKNKIGEISKRDDVKKNLVPFLNVDANNRVEINSLSIKDKYLKSSGLAYLFSTIYPYEYRIFKDERLGGEWFIKAYDNVGELLSEVRRRIVNCTEPVGIDELSSTYSVSREMLLKMREIVVNDGRISLSLDKNVKNKKISNKKLTYREQIVEYMNSVCRPVSVNELSENLSMSKNWVDTTIFLNDAYFAKIDDSTYELKTEHYDALSVGDLIKQLLEVKKKPIGFRKAFDYVKRHRNLPYSKYSEVICELANTLGLRRNKESFFLEEWPPLHEDYKPKVDNSRFLGGTNYKSVIIKSEDEKSKVDTVLNSFIDSHLRKEIKFRYKATRFNSEEKWRCGLVLGQNESYVFMVLPSGKHVNYAKAKILEYRDA